MLFFIVYVKLQNSFVGIVTVVTFRCWEKRIADGK